MIYLFPGNITHLIELTTASPEIFGTAMSVGIITTLEALLVVINGGDTMIKFAARQVVFSLPAQFTKRNQSMSHEASSIFTY